MHLQAFPYNVRQNLMLNYYPYPWATCTLDITLMKMCYLNFDVYHLKCGHALVNHYLGTMVLFENSRSLNLCLYLVNVYKLHSVEYGGANMYSHDHLFHVYPFHYKAKFVKIAKIQMFKLLHI